MSLQAAPLALAIAALSPSAAPAQVPVPGVPFELPWKGYATSHYPDGIGPFASELADFDQDGALDLASVTWYSNPVLSVLPGDGQGGFGAPVTHDLLLGSRDLVVLDHDGDGDQDVLVPDTGQIWEGLTFTPWINTGGTLSPFGMVFASQLGKGAPNDLDVGDFDLNGFLDVAVAHDKYIEYAQSAAIVLRDADGYVQPPLYFTMPSGTNRIVVGDFEDDGQPDFAMGYESNKVTITRNNGLGFDPAVTLASPPSWVAIDPVLEIADVDKDGDEDLAYSSIGTGGFGQGSIALYRGTGAGGFASPELVPMLTGNGAVGLEIADVDGDTWPDFMAAADNVEQWSLVLGDGAGGFLAARALHAGDDPRDATSGDLDGDGDLDVIVTARQSLEACVYLNPGDAGFWQPPYEGMIASSLAPASASHLASADVDQDGDADLAVGYSANFQGTYGLAVRRNLGGGAFGATETYSWNSQPTHVRLWDLNGDAYPELFWLDKAFNPRLHYKLNLGNGAFSPTTVNGPSTYCGTEDGDVQAADLDADGDLDVGIASCLNNVYVHRWTGAGFAAAQNHAKLSAYATCLGFGDVDGDGFPDLATNSVPNQYVEISKGLGNGNFAAPVTLITGRGVNAIRFVDLDFDGNLDLAAAYKLDGGGATVCLGHGDGTFELHADYLGSYAMAGDNLTVADVDADGDRDLLVANGGELLTEGSQDVDLWRNDGAGGFGLVDRLGVGQPVENLFVEDYDGDELADLLVATSPLEGAGAWYFPCFTLLRGVAAPWSGLGHALAGSGGLAPLLGASPAPAGGIALAALVSDTAPLAPGALVIGAARLDLPLFGGLLVPALDLVDPLAASGLGTASKTYVWPSGLPAGIQVWMQAWFLDAGAPLGFSASNAIVGTQL